MADNKWSFSLGNTNNFSFPAPSKWLEAVWGAGDFIAFCGTVVLGFVAWKQSTMATEISAKLISFQAAEYLPTITVTDLLGFSKFESHCQIKNITNDIVLAVMKTTDNTTRFGYAVSPVDGQLDNEKLIHCRTYKLHLRYYGKSIITSPRITGIQFTGSKVTKYFSINQKLDLSLVNEAEMIFWIPIAKQINCSKQVELNIYGMKMGCGYFFVAETE